MRETGLDILVVDDDDGVCTSLTQTLTRLGHDVRAAATLADARAQHGVRVPDAVFLDLRLPDGNGLDLLEELKRQHPQVDVIVITAYLDVDLAIRSMRLGAAELLEKPFTHEQVAGVIQNMVGLPMLARDMPSDLPTNRRVHQLIGNSQPVLEACHNIQLVAQTPHTTVLVLGESGTGKELAARAIHGSSDRASKPFVAINCAALTESLLEAELFGYEKGSFTGASVEGKPGLFEVADGGTIFLDEIGELELTLQAKLLRVLQERMVKRVGGLTERPVDVRVVTSTNRDLEMMAEERTFREDLFYRLNVMPIRMPPLRERGEDIILLAHYFLKTQSGEMGKQLSGFSPKVLDRFREYPWPGNVRELRNVVEHAVIVSRGPRVELDDLMLRSKGSVRSNTTGRHARLGEVQLDLPDHKIATAEKALIALALEKTNGQKTKAADLLGINRATLYNKIKTYGLE